MKRLLAISWEMPPLSGPRAVQVTRTLVALAARGWHSRVVCFGPRSDRYQQDLQLPVEELSGGSVKRIPVASPEERNLFRALWRIVPTAKRFPDEKRVWVPGAVAAARRSLAADPADLIVSFAQPWSDHLVGLRLHRETGLPWVAHFSDPWVDSPYQRGPAWQRRMLAGMEREVIAAATKVVFVNRFAADCVMAKYPAAWRAKAHVVPQGYEWAAFEAPARSPGGPLRIVYTGRFYSGVRTPATLFEALRRLGERDSLADRLAIEIVGGDMQAYQRQARQLGLERIVTFTGRVSPPQARLRAAAADVLLIIDAPSAGPSLFLPSKLIDYLPLARPLLGVTPLEGPTASLLRELGYRAVDPADVEGLESALAELLRAHGAGSLAVSPQHHAVARDYDISVTTARFAGVLDQAVGAA